MIIRPAQDHDDEALWGILEPVLRDGSTYTLPRNISRKDALAYWRRPDHKTFIAENNGQVIGTYYLRANQAGPGEHVCNCGYVVSSTASGKGVARAMNTHSQDIAINAGYRAMQYNAVVATNVRAVTLWQRCGFDIIGTLPGAFLHPDKGYVDAHIMYKILVD